MEDATISPSDLMEAAVGEALALIGVKEAPGTPNSGPVVDLILASVRLPPGNAWCAATVYYIYREAAAWLYTVNPCPRTGGALKLWGLADSHWRVQKPRRGAIYVLDHGNGLGHVGVVTAVAPDGSVLSEVSGNTNAAGSREGNAVALHHGPPERSHKGRLLGYIDFTQPVRLVA